MTRRKLLQYSVLSTQYIAIVAPSAKGYVQPQGECSPTEPNTWTGFASKVIVSDDILSFELTDGRIISVPLAWYPRLVHGTRKERNNWEIGSGVGVHWPDLDEDISVEGLLLGGPSRESARSFQRWLDQRKLKAAI